MRVIGYSYTQIELTISVRKLLFFEDSEDLQLLWLWAPFIQDPEEGTSSSTMCQAISLTVHNV